MKGMSGSIRWKMINVFLYIVSSSQTQLFIIAGPNGAGKSTISEELLKSFKIKAFDWDKEFYAKWSEFVFCFYSSRNAPTGLASAAFID